MISSQPFEVLVAADLAIGPDEWIVRPEHGDPTRDNNFLNSGYFIGKNATVFG
jgi:hypothetical protein